MPASTPRQFGGLVEEVGDQAADGLSRPGLVEAQAGGDDLGGVGGGGGNPEGDELRDQGRVGVQRAGDGNSVAHPLEGLDVVALDVGVEAAVLERVGEVCGPG